MVKFTQDAAALKPPEPPRHALRPIARQLSTRGIKLGHLRLLAALAEFGQISRAAQDLGLAQPAASRLLAEVQHIVGVPLYVRTRRGIDLTAEGQTLARRAARALQEIDDAGREIASTGRLATGDVRVGAVTGAAIQHLLPLVRAARLSLPNVTISVEVATSDILCRQIRSGKMDFALARLALAADAGDIIAETISPEPVSLIVRNGHPLLRQMPVPAQILTDFHWVLPFEDTILRRAVDHALRSRHLPPPAQVFSTSSFLFTLALVQDTNAIAPLATSVALAFSRDNGAIRVLDSDLGIEVETYALLRRAGRQLTPAAMTVLDMVRAQVAPASTTPAEATGLP